MFETGPAMLASARSREAQTRPAPNPLHFTIHREAETTKRLAKKKSRGRGRKRSHAKKQAFIPISRRLHELHFSPVGIEGGLISRGLGLEITRKRSFELDDNISPKTQGITDTMTTLAPKTTYGAPLPQGNNIDAPAIMPLSAGMTARRALAMQDPNSAYTSPTDSSFSGSNDDPESAKNWDEDMVAEWLHSISCSQYERLFRKNNINGENLLEMDKSVLQEMGIDKIGDRVRLFVAIKKLRTRAFSNVKKRNRVCGGPRCG